MAQVLVSVFFLFLAWSALRMPRHALKLQFLCQAKQEMLRKLINEKYKAIQKINPEPQNPRGLLSDPL